MSSTGESSVLIHSLHRPECYGHPVEPVRLVETHISWVLLTGPFAYKIKKPVNLGFVDFSTLEKRRFYCGEELRLNRRLAPDLYLDVVPITGSAEQPRMGGAGPELEFAVQMRQFPAEALLEEVLHRGELTSADLDQLAAEVAAFHARIAVAGPDTPFGSPAAIEQPATENFRDLLADIQDAAQRERLQQLQEWTAAESASRRADFATRKQAGYVRECHGDMHLGNMFLEEAPGGSRRIVIFDCIEFNEAFRWIDVMSEVAFCTMDLCDRGRPDFAYRFLNAYLEQTGDYSGLRVLPFYLVYRALVRAKVADIRLHQRSLPPGKRRYEERERAAYLDLAHSFLRRHVPVLFITHGPSGSGKTYGTQRLVEALGFIRVRSDVERKRLFAADFRPAGTAADLYSRNMTNRTYARLEELAELILQSGYSAAVDATFLGRSRRNRFRALARRLNVPFRILDFQASPALLHRRVAQRAALGRDASEATPDVLHRQLASLEPLADDERQDVIRVDSEAPDDYRALLSAAAAAAPPRA